MARPQTVPVELGHGLGRAEPALLGDSVRSNKAIHQDAAAAVHCFERPLRLPCQVQLTLLGGAGDCRR